MLLGSSAIHSAIRWPLLVRNHPIVLSDVCSLMWTYNVELMAEQQAFTVDIAGFNKCKEVAAELSRKVTKAVAATCDLDVHAIDFLKSSNVSETNDAYGPLNAIKS
jgi:hypothetical protein